ncbi:MULTISPECIES: hypothetical protein [Haloarcula]|uniref:Uncharacterized protein n=2 Tax=Haloarcula TaxID=2237 RepID=A0ACC6VNU5_9EURY|nr:MULTISPECIES: hypothetical protein [Haloarcula]NLV14629.1 hypothetical protein [Haloarcula argentinensis]
MNHHNTRVRTVPGDALFPSLRPSTSSMRSLGSRATALPSLSRPGAVLRLAGSGRSTADALYEHGAALDPSRLQQ